ncbi:MAG: NADH-quinone oxidoreductase subunit J [Phycisphaerales bacterium]|nr:NADH-quinone oxidoreductase subunit J [Phycisphaerales bacterium]
MAPLLLYTIALVGSIALYFVLRPGTFRVRTAAGLLGLGTVIYFGAMVAREAGGLANDSPVLYGLFGVIAIYGAVQMVVNRRPVMAALHFVLVVIASAAMFLLMQAEFMAFALVIVYAGAILITYMFVLMLADQAQNENDVRAMAEYDRTPREPVTAVIVGFIMLAVLSDALYGKGHAALKAPETATAEADARAWRALEVFGPSLEKAVAAVAPGYRRIVVIEGGDAVRVENDKAFVTVIDAEGVRREVQLDPAARPGNTTEVGLALVADFPASLELAGVILTMAMFGAVVLARRQIELGEDQRREVMGMRRLTVDDHEDLISPGDRA